MTRAQSVDVVNDSTTMQSRIDTVLATPDLDWSNDSGWHPGDPLYRRPNPLLWSGDQYARPLIQLIDDNDTYGVRCEPCQVSWRDGDACWNCGAEYPRPSHGAWGPLVTFDETHEWSRASLRPFVEQMDDFARRMAQASVPLVEFQRRFIEWTSVDFAPVEQRAVTWLGADTGRMWVLPTVENVNAPTLSEIEAGEPLWARELTEAAGRVADPVIRIPEDVDLTAAAPVPPPEQVTVTGRRRRPPAFQRYRFDRLVTETRRPRETR